MQGIEVQLRYSHNFHEKNKNSTQNNQKQDTEASRSEHNLGLDFLRNQEPENVLKKVPAKIQMRKRFLIKRKSIRKEHLR